MSLGVRWFGTRDGSAPVLVLLHGGTGRRPSTSAMADLRFLRMTPFAVEVRRRSHRSITVAQIHNPAGGWPRGQGRAALDAFLSGLDLPRAQIVLAGHSSGGHVALAAGADCGGIIALAPWLSGSEPVEHLRGSRVTILHGDRDRVTDPARSAAYVRQLVAAGVSARFQQMAGAGHAMVQRPGQWHRAVADEAIAILLPHMANPNGPTDFPFERPLGP